MSQFQLTESIEISGGQLLTPGVYDTADWPAERIQFLLERNLIQPVSSSEIAPEANSSSSTPIDPARYRQPRVVKNAPSPTN